MGNCSTGRGFVASDRDIDPLCEEMPLASGIVDEACARDGLRVESRARIW
jgi:hypothetical protein